MGEQTIHCECCRGYSDALTGAPAQVCPGLQDWRGVATEQRDLLRKVKVIFGPKMIASCALLLLGDINNALAHFDALVKEASGG